MTSILVGLNFTKRSRASISFGSGSLKHWESLYYEGVPYKCGRCHTHGHSRKEYLIGKPNKEWIKKDLMYVFSPPFSLLKDIQDAPTQVTPPGSTQLDKPSYPLDVSLKNVLSPPKVGLVQEPHFPSSKEVSLQRHAIQFVSPFNYYLWTIFRSFSYFVLIFP